MSNPPETSPEDPPRRPQPTVGGQMIKYCSSCKFVTGGGLLLAGAYVCGLARMSMKPGHLVKTGALVQLYFGSGLMAWGVVIFTMPWLVPPPTNK